MDSDLTPRGPWDWMLVALALVGLALVLHSTW